MFPGKTQRANRSSHEGQLLVDSKEGVGTRFTLGFPVRRSGSKSADKGDKKSISIVGSSADQTHQLVEQAPADDAVANSVDGADAQGSEEVAA